MWVAGIAWRGGQYEVVVVDGQRRAVAGPSVFDGRRVGELVRVLLDHLAEGGGALSCVVDSTNGTLDGHLMAAGLAVYRADRGHCRTGRRTARCRRRCSPPPTQPG